jgi:GxxExxY protein
MKTNDITEILVDIAYVIHNKIGPGILESVYEKIFMYELEKRGLNGENQVPVTVYYDGKDFDEGFRADIIVEEKVVIEIKSVETLRPVHKKQLLTYLRLTDKHVGLLINFNEYLIKDGIVRIVNNFNEKT